jgi:hypothetical protein
MRQLNRKNPARSGYTSLRQVTAFLLLPASSRRECPNRPEEADHRLRHDEQARPKVVWTKNSARFPGPSRGAASLSEGSIGKRAPAAPLIRPRSPRWPAVSTGSATTSGSRTPSHKPDPVPTRRDSPKAGQRQSRPTQGRPPAWRDARARNPFISSHNRRRGQPCAAEDPSPAHSSRGTMAKRSQL